MSHFTVYTKDKCSFCTAAKGWLLKRGHTFEELNVETNPALLEQMVRVVPNARTVPQILLGDYLVGGYTDLIEADRNGVIQMITS